MTARETVIQAVAGGSETIETCPDCEAERVTQEMHAIVDEGTVALGTVVNCDGCGLYFRCQPCGDRIADGRSILQHIIDEHGGTRG